MTEAYKSWQYENRFIKKWPKVGGILFEDSIIYPQIGLSLFFYAQCPCCKDATQRDCADALAVGFTNLLKGMTKIRNSQYCDTKQSIADCQCSYHSRLLNDKICNSTRDFMSYVLCEPIEIDEFKNPELSSYSRSEQEDINIELVKARRTLKEKSDNSVHKSTTIISAKEKAIRCPVKIKSGSSLFIYVMLTNYKNSF